MSEFPNVFKQDWFTKEYNDYVKALKKGDEVIVETKVSIAPFVMGKVVKVLKQYVEVEYRITETSNPDIVKFNYDRGQERATGYYGSWTKFIFPNTPANQKKRDELKGYIDAERRFFIVRGQCRDLMEKLTKVLGWSDYEDLAKVEGLHITLSTALSTYEGKQQ